MEKATAFGQGLILSGGHLGQLKVRVAPGENMPGAGNPDVKLVVFALNLASRENFKQLRMDRPAIEPENQVADPRS
jgi:hypothetical protein